MITNNEYLFEGLIIHPNKVILTLCILLFAFPVWSQEEAVIVGSDTWCPYACSLKDNQVEGFSVELVQEALKLKGMKSIYKVAGFLRVVSNVERGDWDIIVATGPTSAPKLLLSKEFVVHMQFVFVVKKGDTCRYKGIESLKQTILGTVAGYAYGDEISAYVEKYRKTSLVDQMFGETPQKQNIQKLLAGRIKVAIFDEAVVKYWAKQLDVLDKLQIVGDVYGASLSCGFTNNEKGRNLAKAVDEGIRKLRGTETMKRLLNKYNTVTWK